VRTTVAAFDFDGTITRKDTLGPYLEQLVGRRRFLAALVATVPWLVRAAFSRDARDVAKERLLSRCVRGVPEEEAARVAASYAPTIALRDDVVAMLRGHVDAGSVVVLVSASPSLYVREAATLLGATDVVATDLEARDGVLTGRYATPNCRAEEKGRRLQAWLSTRGDVELYAYGNSVDDEPMLALADHPVRV